MKNTSATKAAIAAKRVSKSCSKKGGIRPMKEVAAYGRSSVAKEGKSRPVKAKRLNSEGLNFESTQFSDGSLGIYLNEIGAVSLLSKGQEREMGAKIRAEFGALLEHLLRSGVVLEVLLHRTQVELGYKTTKDERRLALERCSEKGSAALEQARGAYARHGHLEAAAAASLKSVFLGLIEALDFWQSIGLELLEGLSEAVSIVESLSLKGGSTYEAFCEANLMTEGACRDFLKEAFVLQARVVRARNSLMEPNLLLVVSLAAKLHYSMLPFNEIIQEGNLGLMLAAERFDERLGNRFSTFAVNLIKARMKRENDNQGRTIRVPVHQLEEIRRLDKVRAELESKFGREVRSSELALEAGLKATELEELMALKAGVVSLHEAMASDGETPLEEVLPDPDSVTPFYQKVDLTGKLDRYLTSLGALERRVVCCLYGLGGMPHLSVEETSRLLGLGLAELGRVRERALVAIRDEIASLGEFYACAA